MTSIEEIEKHLPAKRKTLLKHLRTHHWKVMEVDREDQDWALDEKWVLESMRENKGFKLVLWFFKSEGLYDRMDRVVATLVNSSEPDAYGVWPSVEFDRRKLQIQMDLFMDSLHKFRITC